MQEMSVFVRQDRLEDVAINVFDRRQADQQRPLTGIAELREDAPALDDRDHGARNEPHVVDGPRPHELGHLPQQGPELGRFIPGDRAADLFFFNSKNAERRPVTAVRKPPNPALSTMKIRPTLSQGKCKVRNRSSAAMRRPG